MDRHQALDILRRYRPALQAKGIEHAAIFGSVARGNNRPDSDLDILIDTRPDARFTIFDYVGLKEYVAKPFRRSGQGNRVS